MTKRKPISGRQEHSLRQREAALATILVYLEPEIIKLRELCEQTDGWRELLQRREMFLSRTARESLLIS